jgi:hypothetical protein
MFFFRFPYFCFYVFHMSTFFSFLGLWPKLHFLKNKIKNDCLIKLQMFINFTPSIFIFILSFKFGHHCFDCYLFFLRSLFKLFYTHTHTHRYNFILHEFFFPIILDFYSFYCYLFCFFKFFKLIFFS